MQGRYTGDLGDFGKYGLLRVLTKAEEGRKLGVVWYLTPDETGNRAGGHTNYLRLEGRRQRQFTDCDEELFQALTRLVGSNQRSVKAVQKSGILPPGTVYHDEVLKLKNLAKPKGKTVREVQRETRESWNLASLVKTKDCEIIFLDPDNGLETGKVEPHSARGQKYAFYTELEPYLQKGQSLVIYHHLNRGSKSVSQIYRKQRDIYERLGRRAFVMRYHRGSPRAFILIPQGYHRQEFMEEIRRMLAGPWGRHFSWVG